MLSIIYYPALAIGAYLIYLFSTYINNAIAAKKVGFPTVHLPLIVQNHVVWMVLGPMSRLWLKRKLPTSIFNRLALTLYGQEFHQRNKPFDDYVKPQIACNPKLRGNGKTYMLVTAGRQEFWTADAEIAREVVSRPNDFVQFDIGNIVLNVFGENVLTTDGAVWARHRRIVASAVTERISSIVWSEAVRQTTALLSLISKRQSTDEDGIESASTNQMFDLIKRVTIHVLYAAGMGDKQDFEGGDEKPQEGKKLTYIDAVKIINENTAGPTIFPTALLLHWPSWLPGSKWLREIGAAKVEFPEHTRDALAKEKQLAAGMGQTRNNVMSALIAASEQGEQHDEKSSKRKGPALSDEELVGNLYIFTAAGFDTTANTVAYALVMLARYPRWQSWLFEELDSLLPSDADVAIDYASVFPRAHRALAILLETLRLYPPIIHIAKMTKHPQTVTTPSNGTFTIPANTTVYVNSVVLHTEPSVWRNLNTTPVELRAAADDEDGIRGDEYDFRPSRWINPIGSSSAIYQPAKGTYLPWSAGPRVCPGQKMAQVEFVGILVTLFSRHRMEVLRKTVSVKGVPEARLLESDDALNKRLDALVENSTPKLALEMDVYNVADGEDRGLGLIWVKRK